MASISTEFEVGEILGKRIRRGKPEYYIQWKGFGPEEDGWEPIRNLSSCLAMVKEFESKRSRSQSPKKGATGSKKSSTSVRRKSSPSKASSPQKRSRSSSRSRAVVKAAVASPPKAEPKSQLTTRGRQIKQEKPAAASPKRSPSKSRARSRSRTPTRLPRKRAASKERVQKSEPQQKAPAKATPSAATPSSGVASGSKIPALSRRKVAAKRSPSPATPSMGLQASESSTRPSLRSTSRDNHAVVKPRLPSPRPSAAGRNKWKKYLPRVQMNQIPFIVLILILIALAITIAFYKRDNIVQFYRRSFVYMKSFTSGKVASSTARE